MVCIIMTRDDEMLNRLLNKKEETLEDVQSPIGSVAVYYSRLACVFSCRIDTFLFIVL